MRSIGPPIDIGNGRRYVYQRGNLSWCVLVLVLYLVMMGEEGEIVKLPTFEITRF